MVIKIKATETATAGALLKKCSERFCKTHRKTPTPEPLCLFFMKVAGLIPATLLKKRQRGPGPGVCLWILQNV